MNGSMNTCRIAGLRPVASPPYTLAFPASIFLGKTDDTQRWIGLIGWAVWVFLGLLPAATQWRGGPRRFVAFGI